MVNIARAGRRITFPASFTLVAAMNPCKCGEGPGPRCTCPLRDSDRYSARVSGPLLDRIDLHVMLERLTGAEFEGIEPEASAPVRQRVIEARERALLRFRRMGLPSSVGCNAEVPRRALADMARLSDTGRKLLGAHVDDGMSGRARERTIRVARTLADLAGREDVGEDDLATALQFRPLREWRRTA